MGKIVYLSMIVVLIAVTQATWYDDISEDLQKVGKDIYEGASQTFKDASEWVSTSFNDVEDFFDGTKEESENNVDKLKAYLQEISDKKEDLKAQATNDQKNAIDRVDDHLKEVEMWSNDIKDQDDSKWDDFKSKVETGLTNMRNDIVAYRNMITNNGHMQLVAGMLSIGCLTIILAQ